MAQVYLLGAPEDEVHGDALAAWLKQRGHVVRTEYGGFAYPPARAGEVTLVISSQKLAMSVKRVQLVNRATDAWETGRLVLCRYDHGLAPAGIADLDMIDLSFEPAREHRYMEVAKALQAAAPAMEPSLEPAAGGPPGAPMSMPAPAPGIPSGESAAGKRSGSAVRLWISAAIVAAISLSLLAAGLWRFAQDPEYVESAQAPVTISEDPEIDQAATSFPPGSALAVAALRGQVVLDTGAPGQGVHVRLIEVETGRASELLTGEMGQFQFTNVPVGGPYELVFIAGGFETQTVRDVYVNPGESASLSIVMSHAFASVETMRESESQARRALPIIIFAVLTSAGVVVGAFIWFWLRARARRRSAAHVEDIGQDKQTDEITRQRDPFADLPEAGEEAGMSPGDAEGVPEVFVSYSHADKDAVYPIVELVEGLGRQVWIDRDAMKAGQGWAGMIVRAIKSSQTFCIMCSARAFDSSHVRREVYLADKYGKTLLPIRLDDAQMPEDIEYFLIDRQWIDMSAVPEDQREAILREAFSA